jgi:hemerythrin-like metal-binding protein
VSGPSVHWTKDLEVGVPVIDEQHKTVHKAVTELEEIVRQKGSRPKLEHALDELVKQITAHFETEERLMAAFDFPEALEHTRIGHTRLFEDVSKLNADYHSGARQIDARSVAFLKGWLARHIDEDKNLAAHLNSSSPVVNVVNQIILSAYGIGASDIHIEAYPGKVPSRVRFRKDGVLFDHMEIPPASCSAVVSRIKIMAKLDISERRKPQDGRIDFSQFGPAKMELRVATIPTTSGLETVVMRLLSAAKLIPIDELGLDPAMLAQLKKIAEKPYGLFLVSGPTGSGKTTTLHSILSYINTPARKIWTAEDPIEITQAGLSQVQMHPKIGWNFASAMRSFLRADPDVIMVGEMRDAETTKSAIEASLTGHLVFSTLHTNSAAESVVRLLDLGMDRFSFSDALLGILAQRLIKRLCEHCKAAYVPARDEIAGLLLEYCADTPLKPADVMRLWRTAHGQGDDEFTLYKPAGCTLCHQTGYTQRVALRELLTASLRITRLIQTAATVEELRNAAIEEGMRTLKQDGIEKVLQGQTDIHQVRAVCG